MKSDECAICGSSENLETHHIKPLSKGGTDLPENKVMLCKNCHKKRHPSKVGTGSQGPYSFERNKTFVASFYIGGWQGKWQEFRKICGREDTTASKKLKEFIEEYVRLHGRGNPQRRIDVILFDKESYTAPKFCGVRGCNGQATGFGVYLLSDKRYALCRAHFKLFAVNEAWKIE